MKATVKKEIFTPFDFTITIESEDELRYMWHLLNLHDSKIRNIATSIKNCSLWTPGSINAYNVFNELDTIAIAKGIRE